MVRMTKVAADIVICLSVEFVIAFSTCVARRIGDDEVIIVGRECEARDSLRLLSLVMESRNAVIVG